MNIVLYWVNLLESVVESIKSIMRSGGILVCFLWDNMTTKENKENLEIRLGKRM